MLEIQKNITNINKTVMSGKKNKYIVVHYVGAVSSAKNNTMYYKDTNRQASAHYFVDEASIWQCVEDKDKAWHCGGVLEGSHHPYRDICTNSNSIGVEMCCKKAASGEWYFEEGTVKNTIELIRSLMSKYNIPIERVIRHYDVTGKKCPAPYVNETKWGEFKEIITRGGNLMSEEYKELKKEISALKAEIEKLIGEKEKVYHYFSDLPEYAKPIIRELFDREIYKGNGAADLNLPETLMRTLVINYRAGLYKEG